jgi:GNAT superfamily N-acetyltransferase
MEPLRRAEPADLDVLLPLIAEFYEVDHHAFDESVLRAALAPLLTGDALGQLWLILADSGDAAGYAVLTWGYSLESGGREGLVDELFVRHRNLGLGSRALEALADRARQAGCRVLFLETEAHNARVRGFYGRHGFAQQDSVWMSRALHGPDDRPR